MGHRSVRIGFLLGALVVCLSPAFATQGPSCAALFLRAEAPRRGLRSPISESALEAAQRRLVRARDQLAVLESQYPRGFHTFRVQQRESMRLTITALIRLGQERRAKHLIRRMMMEFRQNFLDLHENDQALQDLYGLAPTVPPEGQVALATLGRELEGRQIAALEKMGARIWDYVGIAETLFAEAGLRPELTLVPSPFEHSLLSDHVDSVAEQLQQTGSALLQQPVPAFDQRHDVARVVARRILAEFGMWDPESGHELSPTLAEVDNLYRTNVILRAAKMTNEVDYERHEARMETLMRLVNDQALRRVVLEVVNRMSGGTLRSVLAPAMVQAEVVANARVNEARVIEFITNASRIPNDDGGNDQLAQMLTQLISSAPGLLEAIVLRQESIGPINRVKSSRFARETVWGPNKMTFADHLVQIEAQRATLGIRSAVFNGRDSERTLWSVRVLVFALSGYLLWEYGDDGYRVVETGVNHVWSYLSSSPPY